MAAKIDPLGGMFSARVSLKDDSSKALESISDNIEKAVDGSEKLQDGFNGLQDGVDKLHDKTQQVLKDTNDMGILGAALVGIKGKGSIAGQIKAATGAMGGFTKFLAGPVTGGILGLASVVLSLAGTAMMVNDILTLAFIPAALPALFLNAAQAASKLIAPFQRMQQVVKMSDERVIQLSSDVVEAAASMGFALGETVDMMRFLGEQGRINSVEIVEMAANTLLLEKAFTNTGFEALEFQRVLTDIGGLGQKAIMGVANAMQHVASTTILTHGEIQSLINTVSQSLIWKLPRDLRDIALPKMLADISQIAAAYQSIGGDKEAPIDAFDKALDLLDEGGQRIKAIIVGFGGGTQAALEEALNTKDFGAFAVMEARAIQNEMARVGEENFINIVSVYEELLGKSRKNILAAGRLDLDKATRDMAETHKRLADTEEIRKAWHDVSGIFNNIWERVSNLAEAFLTGMGKPVVRILTPIINLIERALETVFDMVSGFSAASAELAGILTLVGAIAFIGSMVVGTFIAPWLAGLAAITAAFVFIGATWDDIGAPIAEVFGVIWDRIGGVVFEVGKLVAFFMLLTNPIGAVVAAVYALWENWDLFMTVLEPGLVSLRQAWGEIKFAFAEMSAAFKEAMGDSAAGLDTFSVFADLLKFVAIALGVVFQVMAKLISGLMFLIKPLMMVIQATLMPFIKLFGMMTDNKDRDLLSMQGAGGAVTEWAGAQANQFEMSGDTPIQLASGGFTKAPTLARLHANEAVVPLDRMTEFIGNTVNIDQQAVVDEVKKLRETIEMLSRRGSGTYKLQGT